jgi:hypothetical protein
MRSVSEPLVLTVVRPYATQEEFLAEESWTIIDDKSMILVGEELEKDTIVRFELVLQDGSRLMRGEAKVTRSVPEADGRPSGVRVRFRRFGASTKELIDRVLADRKKSRRSKRSATPAPLVLEAEPAISLPPEPALPSDPAISMSVPPDVEPDSTVIEVPPIPAPVQASVPAPIQSAAPAPERRERVREGRPGPVEPPPNREELLQRLRERAAKNRAAET